MKISDTQKQLKRAGFDPGALDSDWGPLTQSAMDAYQRSLGILVPTWLIIAERELGIHEIAGSRSNQRIIEYHRHTDLSASSDEVPWCSSFVNFCMDQAGIKGTKSAAAASWMNWGNKSAEFRYGCVCVFTRPGGNHVGFGLAADLTHIAVLGGNQSDQVCVKLMHRAALRGFRWLV